MGPLIKSKQKATRPPKMTTQTLLDFDLGESSSDSDFRIEDHDESDDFSDNSHERDSGGEEEEDDDDESDSDSGTDLSDLRATLFGSPKPHQEQKNIKDVLEQAKSSESIKDKLPTNPICCACLGDRSDDTNEIVECDGCGVSVHEGCYGVSDSASVSSTISSCSTEPWFCEACKANITDPSCELCPNKGGIFKETDVGKWVHLVCALYVPGVAFGEVDQLSSVTLFEMPYSKWGAKTCSLCDDARFARTGVCIGCDAGMCKTYFHVTCAQAAGFLSEAHSEEADHADPFYAHCKVHSDKTMIKHRKRNFNTLRLRMEQRKMLKLEQQNEKPTDEQLRIQRKLHKHQTKYKSIKQIKNDPWVPTQKMPRLLTTSATACRRLMLKAELMGIDTVALEFQEAQMAALADVRKKWHIPPAFSVEFIGYYLDRITRSKDLKLSLENHIELNKKLLSEQQTLREEYDQKIKQNTDVIAKNNKLKDQVTAMHKQIQALCPTKTLPTLENIGRPVVVVNPQTSAPPPARPMSVPTAAALKMGVGFPLVNLGSKDDTGRILSTQRQGNDDLVHECGICKRCNDQHLLAKCDTCHFYYHLGCLNPPLSRHPKKSKLYGWQCSECDKSDDSDVAVNLPKGPRKSRTRFSKDGSIVPVDPSLLQPTIEETTPTKTIAAAEVPSLKRKSIDKSPKKDLGPTEPPNVNGTVETPQEKSVKQPAKKVRRSLSAKKDEGEVKMNAKPVAPTPETPPVQKAAAKPTPNQKLSKADEPKKTLKPEPVAGTTESGAESSSSKANSHTNASPNKTAAAKKIKKNRKSTGSIDTLDGKAAAPKQNHVEKSAPAEKTTSIENNAQIKSTTTMTTAATTASNSSATTATTTNSTSILTATTAITTATKVQKANTDGGLDQGHKQNRKRRKEKHKNKYSSDNEKPSGKEHIKEHNREHNKEHKRKRKKKTHDMENPNNATVAIPKIKIKFKTLPLPGEVAPEPQFFYVSADMVRPMDTSRPTSVETVDDSTINADDLVQNTSQTSDHSNAIRATSTPIGLKSPTVLIATGHPKTPTGPKVAVHRLPSPRKIAKRDSVGTAGNISTNETRNSTSLACDVCHQPGSTQNLVKCDECLKNYHFTCLDPPLKKTPKKRGYSWHCADCDPTDIEST